MQHHIRKLSGKGDEVVAEWESTTVTPERLQEIEAEFHALMKQGYFAADVTEGRNVIVKDFQPDASYVMIPRCQGG